MRQLLISIALFFSLSAVACARNVLLTWTDDINPPTVTYNAYEANGDCATAASFSKINSSSIAPKNYADQNVSFGTRCYYVTAQAVVDSQTVESAASNKSQITVTPSNPTNLTLQLDPP
jgi:hypothetical protein